MYTPSIIECPQETLAPKPSKTVLFCLLIPFVNAASLLQGSYVVDIKDA